MLPQMQLLILLTLSTSLMFVNKMWFHSNIQISSTSLTLLHSYLKSQSLRNSNGANQLWDKSCQSFLALKKRLLKLNQRHSLSDNLQSLLNLLSQFLSLQKELFTFLFSHLLLENNTITKRCWMKLLILEQTKSWEQWRKKF